MVAVSRRSFLRRSATVGAGLAVSGSISTLFPARGALAAPFGGYGPLVPDPDGLLDLPAGFSYTVFSRVPSPFRPGADLLTTGTPIPGRHDGMGAFLDAQGRTVLVRNHELSGDLNPVLGPRRYDRGATAGGTTTVVLGADNRPVLEYGSLAGTRTNCAGGPTPWGTWLSCEENEDVPSASNGLERRHGYVFEVDPRRTPTDPGYLTEAPVPLLAMGRFRHEAVAVDPRSGTVFETEDAGGGHFYRFRPTRPLAGQGSLGEGGVLEVMDAGVGDLQDVTTVGTVLPVTWITVPDPDATTTPVREQVTATVINKLEGCWWGKGAVFFVSSSSNRKPRAHQGQVWRHFPDRDVIELVVQLPVGGIFDGPDNITVSPYGGLMLCEDGSADEQFLVGVDVAGTTFAMARNRVDRDPSSGGQMSELAGVVFSPDARTLFVNIQDPGTTYAITGPFAQAPAPVVPELPAAALLPLAGAAVLGGAIALRSRGRDAEDPLPG